MTFQPVEERFFGDCLGLVDWGRQSAKYFCSIGVHKNKKRPNLNFVKNTKTTLKSFASITLNMLYITNAQGFPQLSKGEVQCLC